MKIERQARSFDSRVLLNRGDLGLQIVDVSSKGLDFLHPGLYKDQRHEPTDLHIEAGMVISC